MTKFHTLSIIGLLLINLIVFDSTGKSTDHPDGDEPDGSPYSVPVGVNGKADWVDYGNMFNYDPLTQSNRPINEETLFIEKKKSGEDEQTIATISKQIKCDCEATKNRLKRCEDSIKLVENGEDNGRHCNKVGYTILKRIIMKVSNKVKEESSPGVQLRLTVDVDDINLWLPQDLENTSKCDYLFNIDPLLDTIMSRIKLIYPKPRDNQSIILYTASTLGTILLSWVFFKFSVRLKIVFLIVTCFMLTVLWEWLDLYQNQEAKNREILERLKGKCLHRQKSWSDYFGNLFASHLSFGQYESSECVEYFVASYNNPVFQVNPLTALVKTFEKIAFYPLQLLGHNMGLAVRNFFAHIPSFYILPFLIAGALVLIYFFKHLGKSVSRAVSTSRDSNQETIVIKEKKRLPLGGRRKIKLTRTRSTGDLRKLTM